MITPMNNRWYYGWQDDRIVVLWKDLHERNDAYANTQFEFDLTQQTKETYIKTQAQSMIEAYTKI